MSFAKTGSRTMTDTRRSNKDLTIYWNAHRVPLVRERNTQRAADDALGRRSTTARRDRPPSVTTNTIESVYTRGAIRSHVSALCSSLPAQKPGLKPHRKRFIPRGSRSHRFENFFQVLDDEILRLTRRRVLGVHNAQTGPLRVE